MIAEPILRHRRARQTRGKCAAWVQFYRVR